MPFPVHSPWSLPIQDKISLGCGEKTTIHVFNVNLDTGIYHFLGVAGDLKSKNKKQNNKYKNKKMCSAVFLFHDSDNKNKKEKVKIHLCRYYRVYYINN